MYFHTYPRDEGKYRNTFPRGSLKNYIGMYIGKYVGRYFNQISEYEHWPGFFMNPLHGLIFHLLTAPSTGGRSKMNDNSGLVV